MGADRGTGGWCWPWARAAQAATAAYFLGLAAVTPALRAHFGLAWPGSAR